MNPEDRLSITCKSYMDYKYPDVLYFHIANERKTSKAHGGKLKKMGVLAGVSDWFIDHPAHGYHGLRIELKVKSIKGVKNGQPDYKLSYPSKEQKIFLKKAHMVGYAVNVCWTIDEFMDTVESYFDGSFAPCDYVQQLIEKEK